MVRFYNKRGTAEQWIREGKQAVKMTRLNCHRFRSNEERLWLGVMAYNPGNLWRRLGVYWPQAGRQNGNSGLLMLRGLTVLRACFRPFRISSRAVSGLVTIYITTYFLAFTRFSLWSEFTGDDLMNLYFAWLQPYRAMLGDVLLFFRWTPNYRPLGALAYKVSFALFDFNLLPLRIFSLGVLAANVFLVYAVARRLTRSREIGVLAALIHAYHFGFSALYCNTGTIYDILCFFFYFSAFLYYLRARRENAYLSPLQLLSLSGLYILALDSKEMAVTLPVLLVFYEVLYNRPSSLKVRVLGLWAVREARAAWLAGAIRKSVV